VIEVDVALVVSEASIGEMMVMVTVYQKTWRKMFQ
jgi:hypothetical protein